MVLEQQKYIEKNPSDGRYRLGLKLFELGRKAVSRFDLREKSRPFLERLVFETGETVHLCILDGAEVVYMDKVEPERSVRMASRIGSRTPAYCTSVGKAIMAYLSAPQVENILRVHGLKPRTQHTIHSVIEMKNELKKVREQGFAVDNEENEEGVRCVGCVVRGATGEPVAAISVSGPAFRVAANKLADLARPVKTAAIELSMELGFHKELDNNHNIKSQMVPWTSAQA